MLDAFGHLAEPQGALPALAPDAFAQAMPGRPIRPASMHRSACARLATPDRGRPFRAQPAAGDPLELAPLGPAVTGGAPSPTPALRSATWRRYCLRRPVAGLADLVIALGLRGLLSVRPVATAAMLVLVALPVAAQDSRPDDAKIVDLHA